ncbi:di/tricarboxylate transporter [Mycetocola sp. CAN_C7]|uniref:hypothetical protein n=1 Tax=Mycetocola sp. CAN_C7 TaxID=2787724 RepID=UPI0018CA4CD9
MGVGDQNKTCYLIEAAPGGVQSRAALLPAFAAALNLSMTGCCWLIRQRDRVGPVATPANTMVMGPGAYRFGDYWKLGLPLLALFVLVATFLVPVIWAF